MQSMYASFTMRSGNRLRYPNAPWYEAACRVEYRAVREVLRCLGALFPYERPTRRGRPPVCYGDLLVVSGLARYNDDSCRFAIPDPSMLITGRYLQSKVPPAASTLRDHMRTEEMYAMNRRVFDITADVARPIETEFAMDSTDVATPNNETVLQRIGKNDDFHEGEKPQD